MMTEEELRKEATSTVEWENTTMIDRPLFVHAYITSAKPREKRIEQLEKENAELKEKLEDTEKARDYWKNSSFDWRHKCTSRKPFKAAVKAQKQLSKAKELIEDMYDQIPSSHSDYYKDVMERARQFLKELEK